MKVLLVCGYAHLTMSRHNGGQIEIVNSDPLVLRDLPQYLQEVNPIVEGVLITDEALSLLTEEDSDKVQFLIGWMAERERTGIPVVLLTREDSLQTELERIGATHAVRLTVILCDYVRIPVFLYRQALDELMRIRGTSDERRNRTFKREGPAEDKPGRRRPFLERFLPKPRGEPKPGATDRTDKEFGNLSRGISRVVAITGHRGSGLTSTVVNLASEACKRGLQVMIIDMDIAYRSTNMYFNRFHDFTKKDEDMNASLIRTLARPQDYMTTAFPLQENLWLAALGYSFDDRKLAGQFYNSAKLVGLLSVLRNRFNIILMDMPLDLFGTFRDAMIHIDTFGLCVPNNLHAVLSTVRNVEVVLNREDSRLLNAKSKLVVTKYNDRSRLQGEPFTPDKVGEVLASGLSDRFDYEMTAGFVPYMSDFDTQIETDIPAVQTGRVYERAYGDILLRLMEGAR
ncbi:AAA family ATPase [Paenibacillus alkalitolerans]|uniref:AAA family ATPase n=1 Tax=Paenibacillus alkalitolerans TaxID=2799335 RepID=UPI0018F393AF|nr:AAA family ATPase [Paenibacillus alkalitolerans]